MVDIYGISIIEQLREYPESHNICVDIGMCYRDQSSGFVNMEDFPGKKSQKLFNVRPKINFSLLETSMEESTVVTEKHFLVGENECTWGPGHWCKDEETAKKCSTLDYCKRKQIGMWSA